jgi:hypothetical protein
LFSLDSHFISALPPQRFKNKLNEIAVNAGIDDFRDGLNTELRKILLPKHGDIGLTITRTEGEYVLEISKLSFSLEATISDNFNVCGKPHFSLEVQWQLKRSTDNQIIDKLTVSCFSPESSETLPTWLSDKEQRKKEIGAILKGIGGKVAVDALIDQRVQDSYWSSLKWCHI